VTFKSLIPGALAAIALAACGGTSHQPPQPFAWLKPAPPPSGWKVATIPTGSVLAYPPSWELIHSDPGAASAALLASPSRLISRYVNATPQQGAETLQDWARFRPDHNGDEGDKDVRVIASATGLHFRAGTGSCVIDRYLTPSAAYQEIACLVYGPRAHTVIVAAAPRRDWAAASAELERAISAFKA
jgi:hypothetical protein